MNKFKSLGDSYTQYIRERFESLLRIHQVVVAIHDHTQWFDDHWKSYDGEIGKSVKMVALNVGGVIECLENGMDLIIKHHSCHSMWRAIKQLHERIVNMLNVKLFRAQNRSSQDVHEQVDDRVDKIIFEVNQLPQLITYEYSYE